MNIEKTIIEALKQELDENNFDSQTLQISGNNIIIKVRDNDMCAYIVALMNGKFKIMKANTLYRMYLLTIEAQHPQAIEKILSYLHNNCEFGRDVRNYLGYDPTKAKETPS